MKPDWDKLMDEFKDSATQLVAEVDCTSDGGKPLCDANGVRGYPTLKWGDPSSLEDYQSGRDYDSMKTFATENLKPICSPANMDLCDDDEKKEIQKYLDMSDDDLSNGIKEKEAELEKAESDFKTLVESLQKQYQDATKEKEDKIAAVKASGLAIMKKVEASKKKDVKDEL
jgi:hypothetical protein